MAPAREVADPKDRASTMVRQRTPSGHTPVNTNTPDAALHARTGPTVIFVVGR